MLPGDTPRLPRHPAPPDLVEGALRRHRAQAARRPARRAMVGAALLVAAGILVALPYGLAPPAGPPSELVLTDALVPPSARVRLAYHAPGALSVGVAGSWNTWDPARTPLVRGDDDIYRVELELPPGRYEYLFVVDGRHWVEDPEAVLHIDDGFGRQNMVLEI